MSTRVRHVLFNPQGTCFKGKRAILEMVYRAFPERKTSDKLQGLLKTFPGQTKAEKLLALAKQLPPGYKLFLIREPRGTRIAKSHYWYILRNGRSE